ncbi:hypothetical protein [Rhodococcus sp. HNM0569]|uniref:hypothetical protein n=1 Tax=Rhodococcus sp. HNM0569 TaxID=2716340 RepID=UPI00146D9D4D|nr:hypothetical protein [Rhodococcus sp. HNM0569]NLU81979.1 hypothetical protein [Rhodococcus sp. HNM0569]
MRTHPAAPALDPRLTLLSRPDGRVQIGWDPERAVVVSPPPGIDGESVLAVLELIDGRRSRPQLLWDARRLGFDPVLARDLFDTLARAGLLRGADPVARAGTVRIHGRGPLGDALERGLDGTAAHVTRSSYYPPDGDVRRWGAVCVVLTDDLVVEPRLVEDLVRAGVVHLHVRIRDGHGVVGPLVLPGRTSCLRCADLVRADLDSDWPHLAAQLLGRTGYARPATILATAAFALEQVDAVLHPYTTRPPCTLDATVEVDTTSGRTSTRHWPLQPDCTCRHLAPL